ncbi:nuclear transport factor 2 family protein [Sphingomonas sabuli]|uniref:Nuclear transport factor 2 family protein n=1 Tax=Sphingomonas sabuli TaxID=2764186 RepID=A0A7G9L4U7_9SPHN|nr:nuclear transport factor 2 family protein [Sphingomonas sabuli]QNM83646.1 nuclear transport factor 2 family protein [Sphingomonas sabuli]
MAFKIKLVIGAALALAACNQNEPAHVDTEAAKQQLLAREDAWNKAYASRDGAALAAIYTDDAAVANPRERLISGKEAIQQATAGLASDPNLKVSFRANRVDVAPSGDLGYTRGQYLMTQTNSATKLPESSQGYYLTVWKKQGGDWKVVEDFVTPGVPLPVVSSSTLVQ